MGRHGRRGPRRPWTPGDLLEVVESLDDLALLVIGVPVVLAVVAAWQVSPSWGVAAILTVLAGVLAGGVVLLRGQEERSWGRAALAVLALLSAGAAISAVGAAMSAAPVAALEALVSRLF